jgi:sarcosine oxidase / L-pipecolate oxidase
VKHLEDALSSIERHPVFAPGIRRLKQPSDFKDYTWQYSGPLTGFKGYYNRLGGYAHSSDTLKGVWEYLAAHGVKSVLGQRVTELVYASDGRCTGVRTADGKVHQADLTVCALGAHGAALLPSLGKFAVARCWSVAHVQLTEDETNLLRGIPTTNIRDLGFFFEPDPKIRLFKICPLGSGYTNTGTDGISLPPPDDLPPPQDFIPQEDESKLRRLLQETFPWMAHRPFVDQKLCWFADTADSDFCIDFVPGTNKTVVCLSGDSGHGFKMMPVFGKWVVQLLETGAQSEQRWKWKTSGTKDYEVSWRIGKSAELKELIEAKERLVRARL